MFSLLIVVIAITLVTALVIAFMHYGGSDTKDKGIDHTLATRGLNDITQLRAAIMTYKATELSDPASLQDLVDKGYIRIIPDGWTDTNAMGETGLRFLQISLGDDTREEVVCSIVNERLGLLKREDPQPFCSAVPDGFMGCCLDSE